MIASERRHLPLMVVVLLIGYALGAARLNADNLWLDELYSLSNMGVFDNPYDLTAVVESLTEHSQNHVPLYFVLGARWAAFAGWSQVSMRFLSLLIGVLLIAWTYRFAADMLDRSTAITAALLLATSGYVLLYFHEIRMYALLLLLTVGHAWLYWRLMSPAAARRLHWLAFILTAVALLYTHVFSLFFFIGLGLRHLIFATYSLTLFPFPIEEAGTSIRKVLPFPRFGRRSRGMGAGRGMSTNSAAPRIERWIQVCAAWAVSALAFLPYLPHYLRGAIAERTITGLQESALSASQLARELGNIVVNGSEILWLPLVLLLVFSFRKRRRPAVIQLMIVWSGIILSLMVFNEVFPLIDRLRFRFFLLSMPFFVILCAHALMTPRRWKVVALPFALLWIAGGLHIHGLGDSWTYAGRNQIFVDIPPLRQYADSLRSRTRELDKVLGFSQSKWVDWPLRHGKSIADYYFGVMLNRDHAFITPDQADSNPNAYLENLIDDHPYLLLTYNPAEKPLILDEVTAALAAEYIACEVLVDNDDLIAQRYVYKTLACDREYQPIHFENGIKIIDKFAHYDSERETVRVVTGWEVADEAQLEAYNVSVQIITSDGQNVRQAGDRHLYDDILKWYAVELSPAGLGAGEYRVAVILYDRNSKAKVGGRDLSTGEVGTILPVLNFKIDE